MRIFKILGLLSLFIGFQQGSFATVDTLSFTQKKGFDTFHIFHYNCKQAWTDLGCLLRKNEYCFHCKDPKNERDSILQNKTRTNDSLFIKIYDEENVLRYTFLRPHAGIFDGEIKLYDKKGVLRSTEQYTTGYIQQSTGKFITVYENPVRTGTWYTYFRNGNLKTTSKYKILADDAALDFHSLIRVLDHHANSGAAKMQRDYIMPIDKLELGFKKLRLPQPFFKSRIKRKKF